MWHVLSFIRHKKGVRQNVSRVNIFYEETYTYGEINCPLLAAVAPVVKLA